MPYICQYASGDCNRSSMLYVGPDLEANKDRYIESLKFFNGQILNIFDTMLTTMLSNLTLTLKKLIILKLLINLNVFTRHKIVKFNIHKIIL